MRPALLITAAVVLSACSRQPGYYSPPAIRPAAASSTGPGHFVAMSAPDAARYVVSGVLLDGGGGWRWCLKQTQLQFAVPRMGGLKFRTEIAVGESTFAQTGPVHIGVEVEGHNIGVIDFDKPDNRTIEFEVPAAVLPASGLAHVTLTADKEWIPPEGGAGRGFILSSAGFVQ